MPIYKGFNNNYKIHDNTTIIYLEKKTGEIFETYIDTEDLQLLIDLDLPWHTMYTKNNNSYYAKAQQYYYDENGKRKANILLLHRIVTRANKNDYIDHKDFDTLNNRKSNLRITKNKFNTRHRDSKNSNNTSGYRNVSWSKDINKWVIQLQVNGTNKVLGEFDDVHEAGKFAEEMRQKYYGKYAGVN